MAALGLGSGPAPSATLISDPLVRAEPARRNETLARFWLDPRADVAAGFAGQRVLIVDAEDTFTGMLAHQLRALGLSVTLRPYRERFCLKDLLWCSRPSRPGMAQPSPAGYLMHGRGLSCARL
jgi:hypothetical protein